MPKFREGDKVRLIAGGPTMTVKGWTQGPEGLELVECEWEADGASHTDTFTEEELDATGASTHA